MTRKIDKKILPKIKFLGSKWVGLGVFGRTHFKMA